MGRTLKHTQKHLVYTYICLCVYIYIYIIISCWGRFLKMKTKNRKLCFLKKPTDIYVILVTLFFVTRIRRNHGGQFKREHNGRLSFEAQLAEDLGQYRRSHQQALPDPLGRAFHLCRTVAIEAALA